MKTETNIGMKTNEKPIIAKFHAVIKMMLGFGFDV